MALIECPECGNQVSDTALSCPACGYQMAVQASMSGRSALLAVALVLATVGITLGAVTGNIFAIGVGVLAFVILAIRMALFQPQ